MALGCRASILKKQKKLVVTNTYGWAHSLKTSIERHLWLGGGLSNVKASSETHLCLWCGASNLKFSSERHLLLGSEASNLKKTSSERHLLLGGGACILKTNSERHLWLAGQASNQGVSRSWPTNIHKPLHTYGNPLEIFSVLCCRGTTAQVRLSLPAANSCSIGLRGKRFQPVFWADYHKNS